MQLRWIAIGVVCFSAALLSACGGAPSSALASRSEASAMSKADGRHDKSKKSDSDDKDECDDASRDKSHSLTLMSKDKDDDDKECKDDDDSDSSKVAQSSLMSSRWGSADEDGNEHDGDEANCKVTICHIPPGNHCNEHTIRVGKSAVPAHIAHGDYTGSCDAPPPPPPVPACMPETAACVTTADCCPGAGLACQANVCAFVG